MEKSTFSQDWKYVRFVCVCVCNVQLYTAAAERERERFWLLTFTKLSPAIPPPPLGARPPPLRRPPRRIKELSGTDLEVFASWPAVLRVRPPAAREAGGHPDGAAAGRGAGREWEREERGEGEGGEREGDVNCVKVGKLLAERLLKVEVAVGGSRRLAGWLVGWPGGPHWPGHMHHTAVPGDLFPRWMGNAVVILLMWNKSIYLSLSNGRTFYTE